MEVNVFLREMYRIGKRWDEMPDINKFYNDFWVRPEHNADIEKATTATEDYW